VVLSAGAEEHKVERAELDRQRRKLPAVGHDRSRQGEVTVAWPQRRWWATYTDGRLKRT
jgi:hypothetical protein